MTPSLNGFAPWLSLHQQSRSYSTIPSILADQQIFSTRAKHLASKYSNRPRSLFDAHSPQQPSVSPASLAFSAPESYFTMHASYLIICPRFTLRVAAVTEKNGGQTDAGRTHAHTHTHTHTDRPTAITLAAHALGTICVYRTHFTNNVGTKAPNFETSALHTEALSRLAL